MKTKQIKSGNQFFGMMFEDEVVVDGIGNTFSNCTFEKGVTVYGLPSKGAQNVFTNCVIRGGIKVLDHPEVEVSHRLMNT